MSQPTFLGLPAELRISIYDYTLENDIETFADSAREPALLSVCRLIQHEYGSIFYATKLIRLDAYYNETDSWCQVTGRQAKQVILNRSTFSDLFDFWGLASARRYCARVCYNQENVQRGILTITGKAGPKRWQWSVQL